MSGLKVCIDARLVPARAGGVASVVLGLAAGLSQLLDGDEEYTLLVYEDVTDWIEPHIRGACRLHRTTPAPSARQSRLRRLGKHVPGLRALSRRMPISAAAARATIERSDGTVERLGADIVHFTRQSAFLTSIPSIYHPHDLQHAHLPGFFSKREIVLRELHHRTYCDAAEMVAVTSTWVRDDLVATYGVDPDKISVVPWAPTVSEYPVPEGTPLRAVRERLGLPQTFVLYPAQTWPHKNHLGLLDALALLRREGTVVPFVSSGHLTDFWDTLVRRSRALGIDDQITWLGYVSPEDLSALYKLCRAVVIPSRFEAASGPMWEAFLSGVPVAASAVTSLPAQADDAALLFDPDSPTQIADTIRALWRDDELCRALIDRGRANVARFSWDRTARLFRAHYRRMGRIDLTDADRLLLAEPALF